MVVVAVIVVLGVVAMVDMLRISRDLETARTLIVEAGTQIEQGELGGARTNLAEAERRLTSANNRLYNRPQYDMLSWVPVVHQNLDALRDGVGRALTMVNSGARILQITQPLENEAGRLDIPLRAGALPIAVVRDALVEVQALAGQLPDISEKPDSPFLLPPVERLADTVYSQASSRRGQLFGVARSLDLLYELAGGNGDRRYLLAVANTAEMRGSGGMVLSYGIIEARDGTFTLGEFGEINELALDNIGPVDPVALRLPADYMARWGELFPTFAWRSTNVSPDFQLAGPTMAAMYASLIGQHIDGVLQIDPAGLAAILTGTGPVEVPELGLISAENVVDVTLNQAYVQFPENDERREFLSVVAETAFNRLVAGDLDSLRPLGEALFRAAQERHIVLWAESATARQQLRFFGADGALPPPQTLDYAILTVQNFSKNKLDYYLDTSLRLEGQRPVAAVGTMTATVTLVNTAPPEGQPPYVFGPNGEEEQNGLYRSIVSLYLPTGTSVVGSSGDSTTRPVALVPEAGRSVVTFGVDLAPGEQRTVVLNLELAPRPAGVPYSLTLVPIPRVRPTVVSVEVVADGAFVRREASPLTTIAQIQAVT